MTTTISPLVSSDLGRQFTIWWYRLFQPYTSSPIWVARVASLLAVLPGMAAMLGIGYLAVGLWGGVLSGLFYLFSAYHMFFGRLALADSTSASMVMIALYFAYRLSRRVNLLDAAISGLMLFVAFGAKISVMPYLGIPIAAFISLSPARNSWRTKTLWLSIALLTSTSSIGLFVIGLRFFGYDFLTNSVSYALTNRGAAPLSSVLSTARIIDSAIAWYNNLSVYIGPLALTLLLISPIILCLRRCFFLPLCFIGPVVIIWASRVQESRFQVLPLALLFLCGAITLADVLRRQKHLIQIIGLGMVFAWGLGQWLPFTIIAANSPRNLPLSQNDFTQYMLSDASGFGLSEVLNSLREYKARHVIGLFSNCQGLRYLALNLVPVTCPRLNPSGENVEELEQLVSDSIADGVFVILESNNPYIPQSVPGRLLTVIERPGGRANLRIYDLAP